MGVFAGELCAAADRGCADYAARGKFVNGFVGEPFFDDENVAWVDAVEDGA
jgi:hypothetical protein